MSAVLDFKKRDKTLYSAPEDFPAIIDVPELPFVRLSGQGNPNGEAFAEAVGALYGFSYALRMSEKSGDAPRNYEAYVVPPLEGRWTLASGTKYDKTKKDSLGWTIMIRQPDFLDKGSFAHFVDSARQKAGKKGESTEAYERLEFCHDREGLCAQLLHKGPYDSEPVSFAKMETWLRENHYERVSMEHREIYLSDPRKADPKSMKTLLRLQVRKI